MQRLEKLVSLIGHHYLSDDPAHDWNHVLRIINTIKKISKDLDIDLPCLLAAAYCHDLVNLPKNHPDRIKASELSANKSQQYLEDAGFTQSEIEKIKDIIIEHSFSKGLRPSSLEAAILQDADRLDALGAIGILRCASVNIQMKTKFYDSADPLAQQRELNDKEFMTDHYFVKLFKLPELMNTPPAKEEALRRTEIMRTFLNELMIEIT
jgi:uncharacterized protein